MKVEVHKLPALECEEVVVNEQGLTVTPTFWTAKAQANVASIKITNNAGKVLFTGLLRVSGKTGKPMLSSSEKKKGFSVAPAVDGEKP